MENALKNWAMNQNISVIRKKIKPKENVGVKFIVTSFEISLVINQVSYGFLQTNGSLLIAAEK